MKRYIIRSLCLLLCLCLLPLLPACGKTGPDLDTAGETWTMGFGSCEISLPDEGPLYVAGYHGGREMQGVLDLQRANAVWMDTGGAGVLLIGIDCVGLSSGTVGEIRSLLSDFCRKTGCASVNVFSTHDHAGIDTLGLWGDTAMEGKNAAFMDNLKAAAVTAAQAAYDSRRPGVLTYAVSDTGDLQRDSRDPQVFDSRLHQLRFVPADGAGGIRLLVYDAHAESLRGDNLLVSRDFPGAVSDLIKAETGDDTLYLPGAVGGLVMTEEQPESHTPDGFDAVANRDATAARLAAAALTPEGCEEIPPRLRLTRQDFDVPLDNTLFMYYRFLGILGNDMKPGGGETGYTLRTSLTLLTLGEVTLAMLPGELFPELRSGEGLTENDPEPLCLIAARYGVDRLLVTGLCNDEIGYIVTPSDWLVNPDLPYIEGIPDDKGENHYEETNSVSREAAFRVSEAMEKALQRHTCP